MILGRIAGQITSTICHPICLGRGLLIVDRISPSGVPSGSYLIAIDTVGAGVGETVLIIDEGNSARQILDTPDMPVRSVVVGIVDDIEIG